MGAGARLPARDPNEAQSGSGVCFVGSGGLCYTSLAMQTSDSVVRRLRLNTPLPLAAWALLFFMQLISPAPAWSWLLVAVSVSLLVAYYWARMLRDRVACTRRTIGTWVIAGDRLREHFTMVNQGSLPVLWARVVDHSDVPGYRADRVESASSQSERTWSATGTCQRRGVFRLGPWDLQMGDPLGFFTVTHHYPETMTIMVYPRASHLPNLQLPRGRAPGHAQSSERAQEDTIMVGGVRQYAPGDSLRRVHWRATAHYDHMMVREFDREPTGDVWLVLDMDAAVQAGEGAEATQEYGVIMAASLAAQFTGKGENRAVGLVMSGAKPALLSPGLSQVQLWRILEALAEAEPAEGRPLATLLAQAGPSLGSGRTVVVITPSQDQSWVAALLPLMARGNAPAVVLVDSRTFQPARGDPSAVIGIRSLLASQRIPSHVVQQGFPFRPIERIRRERTELKTLGATGRVIQVNVQEEV